MRFFVMTLESEPLVRNSFEMFAMYNKLPKKKCIHVVETPAPLLPVVESKELRKIKRSRPSLAVGLQQMPQVISRSGIKLFTDTDITAYAYIISHYNV